MKVYKGGNSFLYFILLLCVVQCQELEEGEGGDFLFRSENDDIAEEFHVPVKRKTGSKTGPKMACEELTLTSYLMSLQVINPESVIALATKNKLEHECHNISKTIHNLESYLKTCTLESVHEQYLQLLNGVKALHKKLCSKDTYHKSFMEHKTCYGQLQTEVADSCNGPADWSEGSDSKRVCRAYQEISDCYYIKASVMCGNKAADIFKELVQCIIESVITVNCTVTMSKEDYKSMSKEQRLILQRQKLNRKGADSVQPSSSHPLGIPQLSTILAVASLAKSVEFII